MGKCVDKNVIIFKIKNWKWIFIETERYNGYSYYNSYYIEYIEEYLNGKRNGKGKEYLIIDANNFMAHPIIFEREYLNRVRKRGK